MVIKKTFDYDMRDDFSLAVYVGYKLIEYEGIKGIDPNNRVAGQLIRCNGITTLELADSPVKEGYESRSVIHNFKNKIITQDDGGEWYATTWDGSLLFVLHKYFRKDFRIVFANNHFTGDVSEWSVSDYSIVEQFMLADGVKQMKLTLDHIYSWFDIFSPGQDWGKVDSLIFKNLQLKKQLFSLTIGAVGREKRAIHSIERTAYMYFSIEFEKIQTREFAYQVAVTLRNFFQMMIGKGVGISRIILNRDNSYDMVSKTLLPQDERENWFLEQSYLPSASEETKRNFNCEYKKIDEKFNAILDRYLCDSKMQRFVATYLTVDHFNIPVSTQLITLVSAVESYYNEAKYSSNGKKVKSALSKLKLLTKLVDDADKLIGDDIHGNITDTGQLLEEMVDARDYIIHGVKKKKPFSESELIPNLIVFKRLICQAMLNVITLQVNSNN